MADWPFRAGSADRDLAASGRRARTFAGVLSRTFARCRRPHRSDRRRLAVAAAVRHRLANAARLAAGWTSRHHPRRGDRQLEGRARVSGADAGILPAATRLGHHSRGDPVPRAHPADEPRRHRIRRDLARTARQRLRLLDDQAPIA